MVISVSGKPGTDYSPFLRDMHRILVEFDARPHWGKLHLFDRDELNSAFPRLADFEAARVDADPNGTFLNSHLRNLFGPSEIIAHNDE